jgi:hypothetical protein
MCAIIEQLRECSGMTGFLRLRPKASRKIMVSFPDNATDVLIYLPDDTTVPFGPDIGEILEASVEQTGDCRRSQPSRRRRARPGALAPQGQETDGQAWHASVVLLLDKFQSRIHSLYSWPPRAACVDG